MVSEFCVSLRMVRRRRLVYTALVLLLSAATTANLVLFCIEDALLFRPLKVQRPEDLVLIRSRFAVASQDATPFAAGQVEALAQAGLPSIEAVAGVGSARLCRIAAGAGVTIDTSCTSVTPRFFDVIGVAWQQGRSFRLDDLKEGPVPVVISASLARRLEQAGRTPFRDALRFKGTVDGTDDPALRIVGVAPEGLHLPEDTNVWLPEVEHPGLVDAHLSLWARLRPGSTLTVARQDLSARGFRDWRGEPLDLDPLGARLVGEGRSSILLLFASSTILLLLAWLHGLSVLGMRLSRAGHEIATRFALGASTWRVTRQYGVEGILVGGVATVLGLLATRWLLPAIVEVLPATAHRHVVLDWPTLAWAAGVFLTASILFLTGTWRLVRAHAQRGLASGVGSADVGRSGILDAIQAVSVAASTGFVYVAAVLALALGRAYWTSPGFEPRQLLHLLVLPPATVAASEEETARVFEALRGEFIRVPAVTHVARAEGGPATGWNIRGQVSSEGSGGLRRSATARIKSVGDDYFAALAVPIIRGRAFARGRDRMGGPSAIVNATLAQRLWPDGDAIGQTVRIADAAYQVIGVCGDFRDGALLAPPSPQIYRYAEWGFELLVRVEGSPDPLLDHLTRVVQSRLPGASIRGRTYRQEYWEATAPQRARALMMAGIAVVAIFSAVLGVLADLLHQLAARRRALGVVLALGASRRQAFAQLFRRTVRWTLGATLGGLALGIGGAVAAAAVLPDTRALESGAVLAALTVVGLGVASAVALPLLRINPARVADSLRQE